MKKLICVLMALLMVLALAGCGTKTLHCDSCGKEVQVAASSNMEEDWIVFCPACEPSLDLD